MASGINLIRIKANDLPTIPKRKCPSENKNDGSKLILVNPIRKSSSKYLHHSFEVILHNISL